MVAVKVADSVSAMYVAGHDIYYMSSNEAGTNPEMYKYNISDRIDDIVCSLKGYSDVWNLMIEGDYAVFSGKFDYGESVKTVRIYNMYIADI